MSAICIDFYHYISSKFTSSGMIWAELEVQDRIADPDNVWWLRLAYYVRDIAKSKTQLIQLDVPKPFLETLTRRTLKKFYLL
jgi:hypothetical protein